MNKVIKFNNKEYKLYSSCQYPGKSILTGQRWDVGTAIYWHKMTSYRGEGFTVTEYEEYLNNNTNNVKQLQPDKVCYSSAETCNIMDKINNKPTYHRGPAEKNKTQITYDDSESRDLAKELFLKEFGITLQSHPGLFTKIKNTDNSIEIFAEYTNGKFCEDLIYFDNNNPKQCIIVEVERTKNVNMFDSVNNDPVLILASKYWKYFDEGNKEHTHYMCFINTDLKKACVIKGSDIKFNRGAYKAIEVDNALKEFYEIDKKFCKVYDLAFTNSAESLLRQSEVKYNLK